MDIKKISALKNFSAEGPAKTAASKGIHARATVWCLKVGQEIHPHDHDGDHIWYIESGEGWYLNDKGEYKVEAGEIIFAPEGEPHGIRAATDLVFISVSAGPNP